MLILAIDTATQVSSVAVASEERLAAELIMQGRLTHSETLMPHIEQVLKMAGSGREKLEGIAVSRGPGSFTGLRIGMAAAKALSYALELPLAGVSTMAALACHYPVTGVRLVTMLDAQKGNAYVQPFHWEKRAGRMHLVPEEEIRVAPLNETVAACGASGQETLLLGDIVRKKIAGRLSLPENVSLPPPYLMMPRAACVARLGLEKLAAGETSNAMDMEPFYLRRSEAEVLWDKRHPGQGEGA